MGQKQYKFFNIKKGQNKFLFNIYNEMNYNIISAQSCFDDHHYFEILQ